MAHIIKAFTLVISFSYCMAPVLAVPQSNQPRVEIEFRGAEDKPAEELTEAVVKNTGNRVYLHRDAIITNKDIVEARVVVGPDKYTRLNADLSRIFNQEVQVNVPEGKKEGAVRESYHVEVVLTKDGAEKLSKATKEYLGKHIAFLIDGKVIDTVLVRGRVRLKTVSITDFTKEEAERIVMGINRQ